MIKLTILGEPASKANGRSLATVGPGGKRRTILRKSDKALSYEENALRQIPPKARVRIEGPVRVTLRIFYASQRPDLDESVILDVLQDRWGRRTPKAAPETIDERDLLRGEIRPLLQAGVYRNDRQVREKHVYHGIDKANPRAEITVELMEAICMT